MFILSGYELSVAITVLIYVLLATGLHVTLGYGGQISMGMAAFVAIGAYTAAMLSTMAGWPLLAVLPASMLLAGFAGVLLGIPSLRVRDDFLAIVTLGFGIIVQSLANRLPFTGGALGISGIPRPAIGGLLLDKASFALLVVLLVVAVMGLTVVLSRSRVGAAWRAVRDDDLAAAAMGLNVPALKVSAVAVGSAYAGLGGGLLAYHLGFVGADTFGLDMSVTVLAMVVIGGVGSFPGAIIAAIGLSLLPEILRPVADLRLLVYGALLALVVIVRPTGLFGSLRWRWRAGRSATVKQAVTDE
jgi:branched-chain amino acid transport system permease protein